MADAEWRMTDSCSGEKSLHELEFNDLNIHLYLTLNYGTASEHLDFDFMVLYNAFVLSWGLTIAQNSIRTISDLDWSRLSDTDPEYRIDASLLEGRRFFMLLDRSRGASVSRADRSARRRCIPNTGSPRFLKVLEFQTYRCISIN